jgi:RNA polymerase sigma factor for flagellar operon FliA
VGESDATLPAARATPARLTTSQQELAAKYTPYARSIAGKFTSRCWDHSPSMRDEYTSVALMALSESARSFDPARGVKFATWAGTRIRYAMLDRRRAMVPLGFRGREGLQPWVYGFIEAEDVELATHFVGGPWVNPEDRYVRDANLYGGTLGRPRTPTRAEIDESREVVEELCRHLPANHEKVVRLIYLGGMTQDETAKAVGYSKSRVSVLHAEAIEILRVVLVSRNLKD